MTRPFTNHIKLSLKVIPFQPISRAYEELHDVRFSCTRCRTDIGLLSTNWHLAPSETFLSLIPYQSFNRFYAFFAFGFNGRQKY